MPSPWTPSFAVISRYAIVVALPGAEREIGVNALSWTVCVVASISLPLPSNAVIVIDTAPAVPAAVRSMLTWLTAG